MSIYGAVKRWFDVPPARTSTPSFPATGRREDEMRADAETILRAAIESVDTSRLVVQAMQTRERSISTEGRIWVAGFGRAVAGMARGLHEVLGERIEAGVLVVPPGTSAYVSPRFEAFHGGHPVPDQAGVAGSCAIRQMAREAQDPDLLICLISGGGSSLLTLPPEELPLEDVRQVTLQLMRVGAPVEEINCVRKHLDQLKGGQLAREAAPARVLALVLSDVAGDAPEVIASGPVSPDDTRFADAVTLLKRHGVWRHVPLAARGYLDRGVCGEVADTPTRSDPLFLNTTTVIVGGGQTAAAAACAEAERLGYEAQLLTPSLDGEARDAGAFLAETARILRDTRGPGRSPNCIVTSGATTLRAPGGHRAGRNQEVALGAAVRIAGLDSVLVASMATDGIDGPTDAAGAIATGCTLARAAEAGLDCEAALEAHEAYGLFATVGDLIESGPTGTHVGDIQIVLVD